MCKYCKNVINENENYIHYGVNVSEREAEIYYHKPSKEFKLGMGTMNHHHITIKYCPFCGRKLEEK